MDPDKVLNWHFFVLLALFISTLVIYFRLVWESLCWGGGLIQKAKTETLLLLGLSDSERMVSIPVQEWRWHIQDCKNLLPGHCCEPNVNFDPQNGHLKVLSYLQWFFSTVLSNVCSKLLQQRKRSCAGCICLIFMCVLKLPVWEKAYSHCLHLFGFPPLSHSPRSQIKYQQKYDN